jgi:hypothetical protein
MKRSMIATALVALGVLALSTVPVSAQQPQQPTVIVPAPSASPPTVVAPGPGGTTVVVPPGSTVTVTPPVTAVPARAIASCEGPAR